MKEPQLPRKYRLYRPLHRVLTLAGRLRVLDRHPALVVQNKLNRLLFRVVLTKNEIWTAPTKDGFSLRVKLNDQQAAPLFFDATYAPLDTPVLADAMQQADTFLDVGANYGYFSTLAASLGVRRVIAVEPNPYLLPRIEESVMINGAAVQIEATACSDHEGVAHLSFDPRMTGWGSIGTSGGREVQITTIDNLVPDCDSRTLVKIDVEGHEFQVLKGAKNAFAARSTFFTEVFAWNAPAVLRLAATQGYIAERYDGRPVDHKTFARHKRTDIILRPGP